MKLSQKWAIPLSILIGGVAPLVSLPGPQAYACQPCTSRLDFDETVLASDLIVIGRKVGEYPSGELVISHQGGPDWIRIEISEILKGRSDQKVIRVNSFNGMCPYGIVLDAGQDHVIFLKKAHVDYVDFNSVNNGCALKTLPVIKDQIRYQDRLMSLTIFKMMIAPLIEQSKPKPPVPPLPADMSVK